MLDLLDKLGDYLILEGVIADRVLLKLEHIGHYATYVVVVLWLGRVWRLKQRKTRR